MKKSFVWFWVLAHVVSSHSLAFANQDEYKAKVTSDDYVERASWRLAHGAINLVTSPANLISAPYHAVQKQGGGDLLYGLGEGIVDTLKYATLGVWDIATFWVPGKGGKDMAVTECGMMKISGKSDCSPCTRDKK